MWAIDMVFVVGGNGGNAGAAAIQSQCEKAGVTCSVIGIPKSIDNDILLVCSLGAALVHDVACCPSVLHAKSLLLMGRVTAAEEPEGCTWCADRQVLWL